MAQREYKEADVLIVGAGPAGLMLAAQLLRHGARPYIIDQIPYPENAENIVMLQARTEEYIRQCGLEEPIIREKGLLCLNRRIPFDGRSTLRILIDAPEEYHTSFYGFLLINDKHVEKPLIQWLGDQACPVYWHSQLTSIRQNDREVMALIDQTGEPVELRCQWVVYTLKASPLQAPHGMHFSDQRSFFIGDATGRYQAAGSQSINTAIQDAVNLGWKLAFAATGKSACSLLNSYQRERQDIPNDLLTMENESVFAPRKPPFGSKLLARLQSAIFRARLRNAGNLLHFRAALSQLTISYRHSPLSHHHAHGSRIKAGDRLPDLPVFDEKTKTPVSLYQWCQKPGFVLLLLGTLNKNSLFVLSQWLKNKYTGIVHLYYLPYSPANGSVFQAFELPPDAVKMLIIRPDLHIGYINDTVNAALVETYMQEVVGIV